jgi:DNA-binding NarL/FixJ family response regulator
MLVDGHHIVRAALRSLLTDLGGITVVGDIGDGREALDLVAKLQPQLVLLEIVLPGLGGVEATRRIVREFPAVRPLILSTLVDEEYLQSSPSRAARFSSVQLFRSM